MLRLSKIYIRLCMNIKVICNIFPQQDNECRLPCTTEHLMNVEASYTRYCLLIELHVEPTSNVTCSFFVFYFFDKIREVKNKREKYPQIFDTLSSVSKFISNSSLWFVNIIFFILKCPLLPLKSLHPFPEELVKQTCTWSTVRI